LLTAKLGEREALGPAERRTEVAHFDAAEAVVRQHEHARGGVDYRDVADAQRVLAVVQDAPAVDFRLAHERIVEHAFVPRSARIELQRDVELGLALAVDADTLRAAHADTGEC